MKKDRVILHSDLNCFYASVEAVLDPSLRGKAVAVCGSTNERHGICLAKSEKAKIAGVKTGMAVWQAKQLCPEIIVAEPHFDTYLQYSKLAREIYKRYTDRIEPYGLDECWLDITGCVGVCADGSTAAREIRRVMREELGLTVSVGISFNKTFAKLGSDMKKPDAQTLITRENFKEKVWRLPASFLLYVGRATNSKLARYGIRTIGDIANSAPEFLKKLLGVNGFELWKYANGLDDAPVAHMDYKAPIKSIGRGVTCISDLLNEDEVWLVLLDLVQEVSHKLKQNELEAWGVQIVIKDSKLFSRQFQTRLEAPTQSPLVMAQKGMELFRGNYNWQQNVRAVTIRAVNLQNAGNSVQVLIDENILKTCRREKLDNTVENIRCKYGSGAIYPASLLGEKKIPANRCHLTVLPGQMRK